MENIPADIVNTSVFRTHRTSLNQGQTQTVSVMSRRSNRHKNPHRDIKSLLLNQHN